MDPVRISFGDLEANATVQPKDFTVHLRDGVEGKIKEIGTFSPKLTVQVKNNDGKNAKGSVTLSSEAGSGEIRERVFVSLLYKDGREQSFNLPIIASIKPGLLVQPNTVSFGVITGSEIIEKVVQVISPNKEQFSILKIESDSDLIQTSFQPFTKGVGYAVSLKIDPVKVTKDLRATVKITTSSKVQPTVIVNVYGIISQ